eukprot:scaffold41449_cov23-Tisochrysis_lutea.AAC.3
MGCRWLHIVCALPVILGWPAPPLVRGEAGQMAYTYWAFSQSLTQWCNSCGFSELVVLLCFRLFSPVPIPKSFS